MRENRLNTEQYFNTINLKDKRRERLFKEMMNITVPKAGGIDAQRSSQPWRSQKDIPAHQSSGKVSDDVVNSIAEATMAKAAATAKGEKVLFIQDYDLGFLQAAEYRRNGILRFGTKRNERTQLHSDNRKRDCIGTGTSENAHKWKNGKVRAKKQAKRKDVPLKTRKTSARAIRPA